MEENAFVFGIKLNRLVAKMRVEKDRKLTSSGQFCRANKEAPFSIGQPKNWTFAHAI